MVVTISGNLLGVRQNLVCNEDEFSWSTSVPENSWLLGFENRKKDIQVVADSLGIDLVNFRNTVYAKSLQQIVGNNLDEVPWMHVLPSRVFKSMLQKLLDQLRMIINDESNGYYTGQLLSNREILMRLERPAIDCQFLNEVLKKETGNPKHSDVLKFKPDEDGFARKTTYSQSSTITGRVTVKSGPGILTLKKEYRKILKSRFKNGKIVQVDISSLEPRIALSLCESEIPSDIYSFIAKEIFANEITRDQAKIATLSCIYGTSAWSLSKRLPDDVNAGLILKSLREYFGINVMEKRLQDSFKSSKFIENIYGRRISSSDALVNHYLQSSGVDASFNVFHKILDLLDSKNATFAPIYVIHDAIVIDVHPDSFKEIENLENIKFAVDNINCKFPVKVEIIKE